jgi:hypothetical protein
MTTTNKTKKTTKQEKKNLTLAWGHSTLNREKVKKVTTRDNARDNGHTNMNFVATKQKKMLNN